MASVLYWHHCIINSIYSKLKNIPLRKKKKRAILTLIFTSLRSKILRQHHITANVWYPLIISYCLTLTLALYWSVVLLAPMYSMCYSKTAAHTFNSFVFFLLFFFFFSFCFFRYSVVSFSLVVARLHGFVLWDSVLFE